MYKNKTKAMRRNDHMQDKSTTKLFTKVKHANKPQFKKWLLLKKKSSKNVYLCRNNSTQKDHNKAMSFLDNHPNYKLYEYIDTEILKRKGFENNNISGYLEYLKYKKD